MRKTLLALIGIVAIAALSAPSFAANNSSDGTNTHAHQGGENADPQPDHGKDNNNAGGCITIC